MTPRLPCSRHRHPALPNRHCPAAARRFGACPKDGGRTLPAGLLPHPAEGSPAIGTPTHRRNRRHPQSGFLAEGSPAAGTPTRGHPSRPSPFLLRALTIALALFGGLARAQNVEFRQSSIPAGIVNQTSYPVQGSEATTVTAPLVFSGYHFTHWTLNGTRVNFATGRARNPLTFTIAEPVHAVANYVPESEDSDGDGLLDWLEIHHFGKLASGADDDADGDGLANKLEVDRGYDPAARDNLVLLC